MYILYTVLYISWGADEENLRDSQELFQFVISSLLIA